MNTVDRPRPRILAPSGYSKVTKEVMDKDVAGQPKGFPTCVTTRLCTRPAKSLGALTISRRPKIDYEFSDPRLGRRYALRFNYPLASVPHYGVTLSPIDSQRTHSRTGRLVLMCGCPSGVHDRGTPDVLDVFVLLQPFSAQLQHN